MYSCRGIAIFFLGQAEFLFFGPKHIHMREREELRGFIQDSMQNSETKSKNAAEFWYISDNNINNSPIICIFHSINYYYCYFSKARLGKHQGALTM